MKSYFQRINPKKPKKFWRAIKHLSNQQSSIPTLTDEEGNEAVTGSQKADVLKFFSNCFNPLIREVFASLDVSKSSGLDGISAKMLKH